MATRSAESGALGGPLGVIEPESGDGEGRDVLAELHLRLEKRVCDLFVKGLSSYLCVYKL